MRAVKLLWPWPKCLFWGAQMGVGLRARRIKGKWHKVAGLNGTWYRDPEQVTPRCASVVCRLFWAKGNFSSRLRRHLPHPNYLEEFELASLPIRDYQK